MTLVNNIIYKIRSCDKEQKGIVLNSLFLF